MLYIAKGFMMMVFVILILTTAVLAGHDGFKVSGEISFEKTGNLYVALLTEEEFNAYEEADDKKESVNIKSPDFGLIIKVSTQNQKTRKASFAFEKIPQGIYCIRAFQDVNANGKLDKGRFGPKEPWGNFRYSRPHFRAPKFKEMAFKVHKDVTGIEIKVK